MISSLKTSNINSCDIGNIIINVNKYYDFISKTSCDIKQTILERVLTFSKNDKIIFYNEFFVNKKLYNYTKIYDYMYSNISYYYRCNFSILKFLDSINKIDTIYDEYKLNNNEYLIMYYLFTYDYNKYNQYIKKYKINKCIIIQKILKIYLQLDERDIKFWSVFCSEIKTIDFKSHEVYDILRSINYLSNYEYKEILNIFRNYFLKYNDIYININSFLDFYFIENENEIDIFMHLLDEYEIKNNDEYYSLICSVMISTCNIYNNIRYFLTKLQITNNINIDDMFMYLYKNFLDRFETKISDVILIFFIKHGLNINEIKILIENYITSSKYTIYNTDIVERINILKRPILINKILN